MGKMSIAQQRFLENAVLIAALQLIFKTLEKSDIPLYSIGEIANTTSGGTPDRGRSEYYGGDIPWIKSGELNDGVIEGSEEYITNIGLSNSSAKIYPEGTLVVALYGATVGKTGILAIDAASNQAVCAVTPINEDVNKYFLFWFLRYKRPDFLKSSFGGAQPNISQKILRETALPLPPSKLQKQICAYLEAIETRLKEKNSVIVPDLPAPLSKINSTVQKVEELAEKIEEARGLRREAVEEVEQLFFSHLLAFFEGSYAKRQLQKKLSSDGLAVVVAGQHIMAEEYNLSGDGFPYITGPADFGEITPIVARWTANPKAIAAPGDVLLTVKGAGVGKLNFAPASEVAIGRQIMAIRPNKMLLSSNFIYYFLKYKENHFQSITTATTVPGIKKSDVEDLQIPLFSLQEQQNIVQEFENVRGQFNRLKQQQTQTSAELNALLPSILDKAFKGEL